MDLGLIKGYANEALSTVSSPKCLSSSLISVLPNSSGSFLRFIVRIAITKKVSMGLFFGNLKQKMDKIIR